ncbi:dicarboxylate/amino acid:cation symporter [Magnetospirillum fulvum]|uniref:Sodium:dicarboxylate symporter n=1 Tax=Magnetospirillum fulvum MGU-K5 TaxID=1316936 RepID=S9S5I8_MAGFU|nr:cation:dicarboxylase symporter family transporter [Magnetospirillum fulvum]EPY01137.1 sodium:dicarboxylate symporter [Magnetospirillum fulvum MGU-K5]
MTLLPSLDGWVRVMSSPAAVFTGLGLGIAIGLVSPESATALAPYGKLFLDLLGMIVLPLLISAVTVSLAKLFETGGAAHQVGRIALAITACMVVAAGIGLATGLIVAPGGNLAQTDIASLGEVVSSSEHQADFEISIIGTPSTAKPEQGLARFIAQIIPDNIFRALSVGDNLKVLMFSLMFGIAVGMTPRGRADALTSALETVFQSCQSMMKGVNTLLPLALCAMVAPLASDMAETPLGPVRAMTMFVSAQCIGALVVFVLFAIVIQQRTGCGFLAPITALREPLILAIGTRNSIACIPSVIESMSSKLGINRKDLELVVPLGIILCRFGPVVFFGISTLFIAQLYRIDLGPSQYMFILFASVMAAMASSGGTGVMTIGLMALLCNPLGLPFEAAVALFLAVDPLLDLVRTVLNVYGTCAVASIVCGRESDQEEEAPDFPPLKSLGI